MKSDFEFFCSALIKICKLNTVKLCTRIQLAHIHIEVTIHIARRLAHPLVRLALSNYNSERNY